MIAADAVRLDAGIHHNIPAAVYHADPAPRPSLSSGVARKILAKSLAHAYAEHPRLGGSRHKLATSAMDTGSLVHALLAGKEAEEIALGDFATWRGKEAQAFAENARANGKTPALREDYEAAQLIAEAVRNKAMLGTTDDPFADGAAEVTGIWEREGEWFRARYDRIIMNAGEPWTAFDWKTTDDASPGQVKRQMRKYGYHLQAAHYLAGMDALCPEFAGRHSFVFVFVEKSAPYSVRRYCLTADSMGCARIEIGQAHDAWEHAMKTNKWPDASSTQTTHLEVTSYDDGDEAAEINL